MPHIRMLPFWVLLFLLGVLPAGCGDLPHLDPGAMAQRLAQPPPARLAVPPPSAALLADAAGSALADALAIALQGQEVPAVAGPAHSGDWRLVTSAEMHETDVVPVFTVQDPAGIDQGAAQGAAVPVRAGLKAGEAVIDAPGALVDGQPIEVAK